MPKGKAFRVPFTISTLYHSLRQVFWLSDQLRSRRLPPRVDPESDAAELVADPSSPITAAGPPRIFTVFRDAGETGFTRITPVQ